MIPNTRDRSLVQGGAMETGAFGISIADSAHLMTLLRDTVYTDKVLAVIREYSANAWDAHREAGKAELPIKVTLPTDDDPTLKIQDFGAGLSKDDVFQVYTQYGASTKRGSDVSVGMLGIGSKSAFAYSDSFTVVSRHGGVKSTYVAVLDQSNKGVMTLLHEEPCGEETGVEIQVPVQPKDIGSFVSTAQKFFMYFQPRPVINTTIAEIPTVITTLKSGIIYSNQRYYGGGFVAVMGCIAYRIDINQLREWEGKSGKLPDYAFNLSGALYFSIGEMQINASREELKYDDSTKERLVTQINALVDEYVEFALNNIDKQNLTPWKKRIAFHELRDLNLPLPKELMPKAEGFISWMPDRFKTFFIKSGREVVSRFSVDNHTRLILRDDRRAHIGFSFIAMDYLIYKKDPDQHDWPEIEKELNGFIEKMELQGIPILRTSQMEWTKPVYRGAKGVYNPKHRALVFKLNMGVNSSDYGAYSEVWEPTDDEVTDTNVFVILTNFKVEGRYNFRSQHRRLLRICEKIGVTVPPIYGYKSTDKKPIKEKDCKGIPYSNWWDEFQKLLRENDKLKDLLTKIAWSEENDYRIYKEGLTRIEGFLDTDHSVTKFARRLYEAEDFFSHRKSLRNELADFSDELRKVKLAANVTKERDEILKKYPLLNLLGLGLEALWGDHAKHVLQYVQLIDVALGKDKP